MPSDSDEDPLLEPLPDHWISSYSEHAAANAAATAVVPNDAPAKATSAAPFKLFLDLPLDLLSDMVDMHNDAIPVRWPIGLNVALAALALQHRRSAVHQT